MGPRYVSRIRKIYYARPQQIIIVVLLCIVKYFFRPRSAVACFSPLSHRCRYAYGYCADYSVAVYNVRYIKRVARTGRVVPIMYIDRLVYLLLRRFIIYSTGAIRYFMVRLQSFICFVPLTGCILRKSVYYRFSPVLHARPSRS
jgi:hypothetical protein